MPAGLHDRAAGAGQRRDQRLLVVDRHDHVVARPHHHGRHRQGLDLRRAVEAEQRVDTLAHHGLGLLARRGGLDGVVVDVPVRLDPARLVGAEDGERREGLRVAAEDGAPRAEQRGHVTAGLEPAAAEDQAVEPAGRELRHRLGDAAARRMAEHHGPVEPGRVEHVQPVAGQPLDVAGRRAAAAAADAALVEADDLEGAPERRGDVGPEAGGAAEAADQQQRPAMAFAEAVERGPVIRLGAEVDDIGGRRHVSPNGLRRPSRVARAFESPGPSFPLLRRASRPAVLRPRSAERCRQVRMAHAAPRDHGLSGRGGMLWTQGGKGLD